MTQIILYTVIFSFLGAAGLFARRFAPARMLSGEELNRRLKETRPTFHGISNRVSVSAGNFVKRSVLPKLFKEFEIIISKFRIYVLKAERMLHDLTHYIRGKREIKSGRSNHPYWNNVGASDDNKDIK